jgi:hypothetical protein
MEKPFRFEWDYEEFSVRTTTSLDGRPYVELVKWCEGENDRRYCYTIAYWTHDREGWNLRFVGDRMLEVSQLHIEKIWPQLCAAQIMFEAWLKDQEEEY